MKRVYGNEYDVEEDMDEIRIIRIKPLEKKHKGPTNLKIRLWACIGKTIN